MKTIHQNWTIDKLVKNMNAIEFPEFQREPTVWNLEKKQRLIDSILRNFDISSIYFYKKEKKYDCIDGRQRINAIWSFLNINDDIDEDHNGFYLKMENEIYSDEGKYNEINTLRYDSLKEKYNEWAQKILDYELNIVMISAIDNEEELNLLFLRAQIASVLNAGEKLKAMTGDMRDWIFYILSQHKFFKKIRIPKRRFVREQVAAQIALNAFSKKYEEIFHRSRYIDLQNFFKAYSTLDTTQKAFTEKIIENLNTISKRFSKKLSYIKNRALAVSVYLFVSDLIEQERDNEIDKFSDFLEKFLKTLKWQIPKGVKMHSAYYDFLNFQTNITQAAGEKTAIEKRHEFLRRYFYEFNEKGKIIGDEKYKEVTRKNPDEERKHISL